MKRILCILLSVALMSPLLASNIKEEDFPFVHINRSNSNISYDGISRIYQDSRGLIWIGTFKGLNRFDGDSFTVYDKDDLGVASDFIHSIEEDSEGNMWVGTDRGVVIYDYRLDTFIPFTTVSNIGTVIDNKVNNIRYVDGKVWMTVNHQGMFSYDIRTGELVNYFVKDGEQVLPQGVRRFIIDNNGDFWLGLYYSGFFKASPSLDRLEELSLGGGQL